MALPNAFYGAFKYGETYYGYVFAYPSSADFNIFDFCYPTEAAMGSMFAFPSITPERYGLPWMWYNVESDLCMYSDDGADSGFRMEYIVPANTFTLQFTVLPTNIPADFSDLANERVFVGAFNQFGKVAGLLISEDEGIALAQTPTGPYIKLLDSADIFDEGTDYFVFRFTVNESTNRGNLYVTPKDVLQATGEHILRYTFTLYDCPAGEPDNVRIEIVGTASNPVQVCLDCIRLDDREKIPNQRPVAVAGDDQTQVLGNYISFDGRGSYDPEGQPLKYWWSLVELPDGSVYRHSISGSAPADSTGYTNVIQGSAGDFSSFLKGDIFVDDTGFSPIMYVASDGSYIVLVQDRLVAGTSVFGYIVQQQIWGGARLTGTLQEVLNIQDAPPGSPAGGDTYIVGEAPSGLWTGMAGYLAEWDATGGSWTFTLPDVNYITYVIGLYDSYRHAGGGVWYTSEPKGWEFDYWEGRTAPIGVLQTDVLRLHVVELVVNDGELDSIPVEVLLNVYETNVQLGLTPDLGFVWNYLSDFWRIVQDLEPVETIWSGLAQVYSDLLMRLWQYQYSKSILDIQRLFQARWIPYLVRYEEPNYEEIPATIDTSLDLAGYSLIPTAVAERGDGTFTESDRTYDLGAVYSNIGSSHYLLLSDTPYKISRVEQGATTKVVTEKAMPVDGVIGIETTPPVSPSDGDAYMVDTPATGGWSGQEGKIAVWDEADSAWLFSDSVRSKGWMIRPSVVSVQSNFSDQRVRPGDTVTFEVRDEDGATVEVDGYVFGVSGSVLIFDAADVAGYVSSSSYTVRFKSVLRRSQMYTDDLVLGIPRLQETIALSRVEGADNPLLEHRDYRVEHVTTDENNDVNTVQFYDFFYPSAIRGFQGSTNSSDRDYFFDTTVDFEAEFGQDADLRDYVLEIEDVGSFRLYQVISATQVELFDPNLELDLTGQKWWIRERSVPADTLWAEITYLDNRPLIEANFGHLVGFNLDVLNERTDDLDYLSAVQGLWYFKWHGRTPYNIRVGSQIILGLPFSQKSGTVVDIQEPYDATQSRILVQDEGSDVIVRSYFFPTSLGLETNPETGQPYAVGDTVAQFAPLCQGVQVVDYISDPEWMAPYIGSEDLYEPQKVHSFGILVNADAFELTNLLFLADYIKGSQENDVVANKPTFTFPLVALIKDLYDTVEISDHLLFGPKPPPSPYLYPDTWPAYVQPSDWDDSPHEVDRTANALYGARTKQSTPPSAGPLRRHKVRYEVVATATGAWAGQEGKVAVWDEDGSSWSFYDASPPAPEQLEFGGLHLADVPGNVPDGWEGAHSEGAPGTHSATVADGTFKFDERDESGHIIHKFDTSLNAVNLLTDGDMEDGIDPGPVRPWQVYNSPTIAAKVTSPVYAGTYSCHIQSADAYEGIHQGISTVLDENVQIGATGWLYVVTGVAVLRIIDQDAASILVELKRNMPSNMWIPFTLHAWSASSGATPMRLQILTGPAGAEFYVDNVGFYKELMPWEQWGFDRAYQGRTGGFTKGGIPDEKWAFKMYGEHS